MVVHTKDYTIGVGSSKSMVLKFAIQNIGPWRSHDQYNAFDNCPQNMLPMIKSCLTSAVFILFFFHLRAQGTTRGTAIPLMVYSNCAPTQAGSGNHTTANNAINCGGFTGFAQDALWFSFVAPANFVDVRVVGNGSSDPNVGYDPVVVAYNTNGTTVMMCSDAGFGPGTQESFTFSGLTPGSVYYLWVYDWPDNGGLFQICLTNPSQPLPVHFVDVKILDDGEEPVLIWEVEEDEHASFYQIEASVDAVLFTVVEEVSVEKENGGIYQKAIPAQLPYLYYRIRAVDFDGSSTYSKVLKRKENVKTMVYPNPAREVLQLNSGAHQASKMKLFHQSGQVYEINAVGGTLDVSALPRGLYFLQISDSQGTDLQKILLL